MKTKQEVDLMLREAPQMAGIIFKKALKPYHNNIEILQAFGKILETKPVGYWLIRESRQEGKITVSIKRIGKIDHYRFAFKDGRWKVAPPSEVGEFEPLDRQMIGFQCQQLINLLSEKNFDMNKLILPGFHEQSDNSSYTAYQYKTIGKSHIRYDDPIESLNFVINKIKASCIEGTELQELEFAPDLTLDNEALFVSWLERNKLTDGLIDPISFNLMKKAYIISESGRAFEYTTLFDEEGRLRLEQCPITRREIINRPYRVEEYTTKLAVCLDLFHIMVGKAQILRQAVSNDPVVEHFESTPSPLQAMSVFAHKSADQSDQSLSVEEDQLEDITTDFADKESAKSDLHELSLFAFNSNAQGSPSENNTNIDFIDLGHKHHRGL